jgi:LPXTG-site transpeptidase (sortase) family protein
VKILPKILISIGIILITFSVLLFIYIFAPVFQIEVNYNLNKPKKTINEIKPLDKNFGIIIPKIGANAKIVANVDPYNANIYQIALTKGVAQAKGTAFPNQVGNMFLFSHSSANLLEATRYNSVFYLLSKLKKDDEIYIFYKNVKYKYKVYQTKIVDPKDVFYISTRLPKTETDKQAKLGIKTLTLMTCWPAGTNYKRLLVIANSI